MQRPARPDGAEELHQQSGVAHRRETADDRAGDGQDGALAEHEEAERPPAVTDGGEQAELRRPPVEVEAEQQTDQQERGDDQEEAEAEE